MIITRLLKSTHCRHG